MKGERVTRVDFAGLVQFQEAPPEPNAPIGETFRAYIGVDGSLHMEGRINGIGVYLYENDLGESWGELRLPEHVFAEATIEGWKRITLTDEHPSVLVTPENWRTYAVGSLGSNVRPDSERTYTLADVTCKDETAIAKVRNGKIALSCGYELTRIAQHGFYNGVEYHYIQTEITPNHVSIVDTARGPGCAFIVDGTRSRAYTDGVRTMKKIKISNTKNVDGKVMVGETEVEVSDEVAAMVADLQAKIVALEAKMAEGESAAGESSASMAVADVDPEADPEDPEAESMDSAKGKRSGRTNAADAARIKFLETQLRARGNVDAQVDARLRLGRDAATILGADFKIDGKSDTSVKVAIVKAVSPEFSFDGVDVKDPQVLNALYKLACDSHRARRDSSGDLLALAGLGNSIKALTNSDGTKVDLDQLAADSINKSFR